jgi:hypothetical protein
MFKKKYFCNLILLLMILNTKTKLSSELRTILKNLNKSEIKFGRQSIAFLVTNKKSKKLQIRSIF